MEYTPETGQAGVSETNILLNQITPGMVIAAVEAYYAWLESAERHSDRGELALVSRVYAAMQVQATREAL